MDLVIDANILFSALIKEGATAELLFIDDFHLLAPEYLFTEFARNEEEILKKTHRTKDEFRRVLSALERRVHLVPKKEIEPFIPRAEEICPDAKDVVYFALALRNGAAVWSNEKRLKEEQDVVKVYATHDLIEFLHSRGHKLDSV